MTTDLEDFKKSTCGHVGSEAINGYWAFKSIETSRLKREHGMKTMYLAGHCKQEGGELVAVSTYPKPNPIPSTIQQDLSPVLIFNDVTLLGLEFARYGARERNGYRLLLG